MPVDSSVSNRLPEAHDVLCPPQNADGSFTETVLLVDQRDEVVGHGEKLRVHTDGTLHRAFSIFVFDSRGRLLLQRRAARKYHSPLLWSNTCCGHPRPGETTMQAGRRRLKEEMGLACELFAASALVYRVQLADGLIEHEYDHILVGRCDDTPVPNADEVDDWRWTAPSALLRRLASDKGEYTEWLKVILGTASVAGAIGITNTQARP